MGPWATAAYPSQPPATAEAWSPTPRLPHLSREEAHWRTPMQGRPGQQARKKELAPQKTASNLKHLKNFSFNILLCIKKQSPRFQKNAKIWWRKKKAWKRGRRGRKLRVAYPQMLWGEGSLSYTDAPQVPVKCRTSWPTFHI